VRSAFGSWIGLAGGIGATGGVMVNLAFRQSFFTVKNVDGAYIGLHCLLRRGLLGHLGRLHAAASWPAPRSLSLL
jgi:nitrate/nitrite transporter NarK